MTRDLNVAKFKAEVNIVITPVNAYNDELTDGGVFTFTTVIREKKLSDVMLRLERINDDRQE